MGSRRYSPEIARQYSQEIARQYSQENAEDRQELFERKVQLVIQWNKDAEGKSFIGCFMKELLRSAVEVTGGDYRLEFPRDFHLQHGDSFTSTVTFEMRDANRNKRSWEIKLSWVRSMDKIRVFAMGKGGWRAFVEDNNFNQGDVLFFLLIAKSRFRVVPARRPE